MLPTVEGEQRSGRTSLAGGASKTPFRALHIAGSFSREGGKARSGEELIFPSNCNCGMSLR